MDDVLISQLPIPMVRAAMRHLVAMCPKGSQLLSKNVKKQFLEQSPPLPKAEQLFPGRGTQGQLAEYMALTRCLLSCHAIDECLVYLTHLYNAIPQAAVSWKEDPGLATTLEQISGDTVQAIQSIKESVSDEPSDLRPGLTALIDALRNCARFCQEHALPFPFSRAAYSVADVIELLFPKEGDVDRSFIQSSHLKLQLPAFEANGTHLETVTLGKLTVPRLFNGLWQMASATAWGSASEEGLEAHLLELVKAGFVATDMADHYGDSELIYGTFRNRLPSTVSSRVLAATKWCVFKPLSGPPTHELVLHAVKERCKRLGGKCDLLQFHWDDKTNEDYLRVIQILVDLTVSHPELVTEIGLVNFDARTTEKVCKYMIEKTGKVGVVTNQFSLVDSRPQFALCEICQKYDIKLLTYGSFLGGFLSDRWLNKPVPDIYSTSSTLTPSQRKYFDMIQEWDSWQEFQNLLHALKKVADSHSVSVSNVATRWVLQQPAVGSVIVGTRLGVSSNAASNLETFSFTLSPADISSIEAIATKSKGSALFECIGDCGAEYSH
ncbi:MAG: hypothetical protein CYPHOPRED_001593 [Cyphobasidiales sp. Tagirdzhanova-0007]|nr:MAG: hypothetical protein CYPHOPRED_001593 [Cyphobasidiales sp. Tagirdzhanova-0007]